VQGLDRYAYTFNNPINYTDPSGHDPHWCEGDDLCMFDWFESHSPKGGDGYFKEYEITVDDKMTNRERRAIFAGAYAVGSAFAKTRGKGESASTAFKEKYEPLQFVKTDKFTYTDEFGKTEEYYTGCVTGGNTITCADFTYAYFQSDVNNIVHELGHVFNNLHGGSPADFAYNYIDDRNKILRPTETIDWQQNTLATGGEMFGDMFVAWTFDAWNDRNPALVTKVSDEMTSNMADWLNQ
jgi:hypothetical protein